MSREFLENHSRVMAGTTLTVAVTSHSTFLGKICCKKPKPNSTCIETFVFAALLFTSLMYFKVTMVIGGLLAVLLFRRVRWVCLHHFQVVAQPHWCYATPQDASFYTFQFQCIHNAASSKYNSSQTLIYSFKDIVVSSYKSGLLVLSISFLPITDRSYWTIYFWKIKYTKLQNLVLPMELWTLNSAIKAKLLEAWPSKIDLYCFEIDQLHL